MVLFGNKKEELQSNDIRRFIEAQNDIYDCVVKELSDGKKRTHYMWFIFPQIRGLGYSYMSYYFGINDIDEAKKYLNEPLLYSRLAQCCSILLELDTNNPEEIFGEIDAMKLKSSMTLFKTVSEMPIFQKVLDKFFNGYEDEKTIEILLTQKSEKE